MDGVYSGISQAVVRLPAAASDETKRADLKKVFHRMRALYPSKTIYVTLTANVILRSTISTEFSLFFGQVSSSSSSSSSTREIWPLTQISLAI